VDNSQLDNIADIAKKVTAENDRRHRQARSISQLLSERDEVLVAMCELADIDVQSETTEIIVDNLKSFNQTLVDYTALGHFEIYERIVSGNERRVSVNQVANRVYPKISETTEKFVEFNDKYEGVDDRESLMGLRDDLLQLGEALAERIESEDLLLREISGKSNERA